MAVLMVVMIMPAIGGATPAGTVAPEPIPMAITQPLRGVTPGALATPTGRRLPESGLMVLVGSALIGFASIVRRMTRT